MRCNPLLVKCGLHLFLLFQQFYVSFGDDEYPAQYGYAKYKVSYLSRFRGLATAGPLFAYCLGKCCLI